MKGEVVEWIFPSSFGEPTHYRISVESLAMHHINRVVHNGEGDRTHELMRYLNGWTHFINNYKQVYNTLINSILVSYLVRWQNNKLSSDAHPLFWYDFELKHLIAVRVLAQLGHTLLLVPENAPLRFLAYQAFHDQWLYLQILLRYSNFPVLFALYSLKFKWFFDVRAILYLLTF